MPSASGEVFSTILTIHSRANFCCEGELAQLVERCDRTAEVRGSNPLFSIPRNAWAMQLRNPQIHRLSLLILLCFVVVVSILSRPSSLITFTLVAVAGGLTSPQPEQH